MTRASHGVSLPVIDYDHLEAFARVIKPGESLKAHGMLYGQLIGGNNDREERLTLLPLDSLLRAS